MHYLVTCFFVGVLIGGAVHAVRVVTGIGIPTRPVGGKRHKCPWT